MTGETRTHDVIVIGGGLVGLALAAALGNSGLRVALTDRSILVPEDAGDEADWDPRVYAISPGSASFLRALGVWQRLPCARVAAVEAMEIFGDRGGMIAFSAYEIGERALAWMVENRSLSAALIEAVRTSPLVDAFAPASPKQIAWDVAGVELKLDDGRALSARLIVAADGVHSWTRRQAGLLQEPAMYGQSALVANFATTVPHRGRAFQWFLSEQGVLAWLPLPGQRMSMVWSAPQALADELLALDPAALAERVAAAGARTLGALSPVTPAKGFPLSFLHLPTAIAHRMALVGDAAHGIHPLAGQGLNLGFGDAAALSQVLAARGVVADAGAPILLERYARRRAEPVLAMQAVTEGLHRLFSANVPFARQLRNAGMLLLGALPPVRRVLTQPALR